MAERGYFFTNVIKILKELMTNQYGLSSSELAERCGVDRRTIQRYLQAMTRFLPIFEEDVYGDRRRKRYRLERLPGDSGIPRVVFGLEEIIALKFYQSLLPNTGDLPFHDELMHTFDKLNLALKPGLLPEFDRFRHVFTCYEKNYKNYREHRSTINRITQAILTRNTARITYHAFQSDTTRTYRTDPQRLFFYDGGLYLTAYVHGIRDIWNFAIERIRKIELLPGAYFEPLAPDRLEKRAATAFRIYSDKPYRSRFRFPPHMRPYVEERIWHPSQIISTQDDGSIEITFFAGGTYDLMRWALSFGADIEVLEPKSLRAEVAAHIKMAADLYNDACQ